MYRSVCRSRSTSSYPDYHRKPAYFLKTCPYLWEAVKNLPLQLGPKPAHFGAGFQKIVEKTCPNSSIWRRFVFKTKTCPYRKHASENLPLRKTQTCLGRFSMIITVASVLLLQNPKDRYDARSDVTTLDPWSIRPIDPWELALAT